MRFFADDEDAFGLEDLLQVSRPHVQLPADAAGLLSPSACCRDPRTAMAATSGCAQTSLVSVAALSLTQMYHSVVSCGISSVPCGLAAHGTPYHAWPWSRTSGMQALCMMEEAATWVPAKPWELRSSSRQETDADSLSPAVKAHLGRLLDEAERADGPCRVEA